MAAGPDETAADMESFGAPPEVLARLAETEETEQQEVIAIWPENWDIVIAFMAVSTQWNVISQGMEGHLHYVGLNYAGVEARLQGSGLLPPARTSVGMKRRADFWDGLAVMEAAARARLNNMPDLRDDA